MLSGLFETLLFALGVTGPIFLVVVLGALFKRVGLIDDAFIQTASKLVFMVALPAVLFFSIVKADLKEVLNPLLLSVVCIGTFLLFVTISLLAKFFVNNPRDVGVFTQGCFRGNLGIVGLAFCANAYGEVGMAAASIYIAAVTILYNVLSVYTLQQSLSENKKATWASVASAIVRNPLILSIIAGLIVGQMDIKFHSVVLQTGEYFSQMTLPLALLCIGGSLSLKRNETVISVSMWATFFKLIVTPLCLTTLLYFTGFRGMDLGIVFLMSSAPTAAASFVMVQALKGNASLAANIIVFTTLGSIVTVSIGLLLLKNLNVI